MTDLATPLRLQGSLGLLIMRALEVVVFPCQLEESITR